MHALYIFSVWLHILAAIVWIGGMAFVVLVVVPYLKGADNAQRGAFFQRTGQSFRTIGWICFAVILVTGSINLWMRGVRFQSFLDPAFRGSSFGAAVITKLALFLLVLLISALHDFQLGPRATLVMRGAPASKEAQALRLRASLMGRANMLLALGLVFVGVVLVRGWP